MDKQEIEKWFDEEFLKREVGCKMCEFGYYPISDDIKDFIFNEILPEVLKSVLPENPDPRRAPNELMQCWAEGRCKHSSEIKQKARELYNINI